jgi:protein-tyrosine-phosphatase
LFLSTANYFRGPAAEALLKNMIASPRISIYSRVFDISKPLRGRLTSHTKKFLVDRKISLGTLSPERMQLELDDLQIADQIILVGDESEHHTMLCRFMLEALDLKKSGLHNKEVTIPKHIHPELSEKLRYTKEIEKKCYHWNIPRFEVNVSPTSTLEGLHMKVESYSKFFLPTKK